MNWHIEKIAYSRWLVTNGKVQFVTNDKRAAEWLCRLCNWITDDGEDSPTEENV